MALVVLICSRGRVLRQTARQYNVSLAIFHCRVNGFVEMRRNPGLNLVLSGTMEQRLVEYAIEKSDMGFGLLV